MKWIYGIPSVEAVRQHEILHPGLMSHNRSYCLHDINVCRIDKPGGDVVSVDQEDSHGLWICIDDKATLGAGSPHILRLRVVKNEILQAVGYCMWMPLVETTWAMRSRYFPLGSDGLPIDYIHGKD